MYRNNNKKKRCLLIKTNLCNKIVVSVNVTNSIIVLTNTENSIIEVNTVQTNCEIKSRIINQPLSVSTIKLNEAIKGNVTSINNHLLISYDTINPNIAVMIQRNPLNLIIDNKLLDVLVNEHNGIKVHCSNICTEVKYDFNLYIVLEGTFITRDDEPFKVSSNGVLQ